jgi:site-specific recombinase XerD
MEEGIGEFENYLRRRYPGSSTIKHYISDLQLFSRFAQKLPQEVARQDIDRFVEDQLAQGHAATTINRRLASLHHFFEFVAEEAGVDTWPNPVVWRRHRVKEGKVLPRDVSDSVVERLLAWIDHPRDRLMFALMYQVGLRVGEVAAVQVSDLIRGDRSGGGGRLRVRGKGQKERMVPLSSELVGQWDDWLEQRPAGTTALLFVTRRQEGISVRGIQERLGHYCRQASVQFSCHQLRHTFGRRMAEGEMPLPSLAKLLGHAQVSTTQVYVSGAVVEVRAHYEAAMKRLGVQGLADAGSHPEPGRQPRSPGEEQASVVGVEKDKEPVDMSRFWRDLPSWLAGLLEDYLGRQQRRWKASQVGHHARARAQTLHQVWQWLINERGVSGLASLTRQDVQAYVQARLVEGVAASTLNRQLRDLWAFLRSIEDQGPKISPDVFRVPRLKEPKPLPRYLDEAAYQRLEMHLLVETRSGSRDDHLDLAWFYLLAHTGVRLGELCDLRLDDLDLAGQRLAVREGKGLRDRMIPLSTTLCRVLGDHLAVQTPAPTDHLLIFRQKPIKPTFVRDRLSRYGAAVGVEVSPHRLRHTLATRLVNAGMEITSIQRLLGHEKLDTTLIYAQVHDTTVERDFRQAMARLTIGPDKQPLPDPTASGSLVEALFAHTPVSTMAQAVNYV